MSKRKSVSRPYTAWDVDHHDHPAILVLSDAAYRGLHRMTSYSRKYNTDGFVPTQIVRANVKPAALKQLLQTAPGSDHPLVEQTDGGYQIVKFDSWQMTKAQIVDLTNKRRAAGAKGGSSAKQNPSKDQANV